MKKEITKQINNKNTTKAKQNKVNKNKVNSKNRNNSKNKNNAKNKKIKQNNNLSKLLSFFLNIALIIAISYAIILTVKLMFPLEDYDIIKTYSEANNLSEELVCAIINVESGFNSTAVSNKGASGYMQIMEQTALWGIETLGIEGATYDNIFDPELNIAIGTWYISNLITQFGSEDMAIISYNAGSGNVTNWLNEYNGNEEELLKNIPFEETKNYYFKVKTNEMVYKFLLKYIYN